MPIHKKIMKYLNRVTTWMSKDLRDKLKSNCSVTRSGILFTCLNTVSCSGHKGEIKYNNDSTVRSEIHKIPKVSSIYKGY